MKEINDVQAQFIIENKKIPQELLDSGEKVAIVLTQDWCPQWLYMEKWLKESEEKGIKSYFLSYNNKSYSNEFMNVKESVFANDLVPYVRYYVKGELVDDSNYVSEELFLSNFS